MTKEDIRKKYIALRKNFSKKEILAMSLEIFSQFLENFEVFSGQNVHIFLSIEKFNEVDTQIFINYFKEKGANIFVPKMIGDQLIAVQLKEEEFLVKNSFGILEPASIINECANFDYVITPLLYVDNLGNRVGYGKGYYDQFFSEINKNAKKIGVGFFVPDEDVEDFSTTDVALDYLITPDFMLSFKGLEKKSRK
ncbi:5-formyltetrahydrofolate cyclo-ligase [Frigoriflavimonas asaccharolytica]|uniref:5-formyltetrahydrofolate cyclo-ligase n=1 Tax=Frigoriflavimonas asaccharolytica TaxID=2735899 RepID=A0A8J8GBM9_9FLAO|nr:5-formyltetrahydrofolate cyclo-ligase [Frigoriflavimonas asaccharolytica]NRS92722.1 5-formyltetrahydrofolate cyclo-ligase [Frigoriflavimonas asaccharolytica]